MEEDLSSMSSLSMPNSQLTTGQTDIIDRSVVKDACKVDSADTNDVNSEQALERAKADAIETAAALEDLVEGIRAVKRILEHPIDARKLDSGRCVDESPDANLVSNLSKNLVGVLGSELIGLLNAAQMAKGHTKLRIDDDKSIVEELHRAKEITYKLNDRVVRAESTNVRLKAENKVLVKEVQTLRGDRRVLIQEVKALRKLARRTNQFDTWRLLEGHMREATTVHESVLRNKTFKSRFAGIDPPGNKVTNKTDVQDINFNTQRDNFTKTSTITPEKENTVQHASTYFPRKQSHDGYEVIEVDKNFDKVLKYTMSNHKTTRCAHKANATKSMHAQKSTSPKQRGLSFPLGISNSLSTGLDRFRNVLQESAKDCQQPTQQLSQKGERGKKKIHKHISDDVSMASTRNQNNCKILDDEATKSTKSCSFEINSSLNLSTSMISYSDDEMGDNPSLQISIDEGSSFINPDLGRASSTSPLMITPESSPLVWQSRNISLKPNCNPNVLRTLAIPNANASKGTRESFMALKPRPSSFLS